MVWVDERPELGLRPRVAIGIHRTDEQRGQLGTAGRPTFAGTIWVQQGSRPLADDAEEVLRGAAVLAARIMTRLAARPSAHLLQVQQVLGLAGRDGVDTETLARELGVVTDGRAAVIGFDSRGRHPRLAEVLALSASAFRPDAQVAPNGSRVYVLLPDCGRVSSVVSWIRGTIATLNAELGLALRAVIAAPVPGLAGAAAARGEIDRVLDSAERHPVAIGEVTTLAEARTTVLLDEIVTLVSGDERLIDPRVRRLREHEPALAQTLQTYLDSFGDVGAVRDRPVPVRELDQEAATLLLGHGADLDGIGEAHLAHSNSCRVTPKRRRMPRSVPIARSRPCACGIGRRTSPSWTVQCPPLPRLATTSNATPRALAIRRSRRISSSLVIHHPRDPLSRHS